MKGNSMQDQNQIKELTGPEAVAALASRIGEPHNPDNDAVEDELRKAGAVLTCRVGFCGPSLWRLGGHWITPLDGVAQNIGAVWQRRSKVSSDEERSRYG